MGLERLSLLIMDDVVEANRRAADEAWREMHRRPEVMPIPDGGAPANPGATLAELLGAVVRRLTRTPLVPPGPAVRPIAPRPRFRGES